MASQISHVIYAINFLRKDTRAENIKEIPFIIGCLFPDIIRLTDTLSREVTHKNFDINLSFEGFDSFHAGWKFHLYCDKAREWFLRKNNFYEIPHTKDSSYASNKILEDILLYEEYIIDYERAIQYVNNLPPISTNLMNQPLISKWYQSILEYISRRPDEISICLMLKNFNTPENEISDIVNSINIIRNNPAAVTLLEDVSENILSYEKEAVQPASQDNLN